MDVSARTPLLAADSTPPPPAESGAGPGAGDSPCARPRPGDYDEARRGLGFYDSMAMILGTQIGSGIFISPGLVVGNAGSEPGALLIWFLAGVLAWACALCYVELGTRMPLNGGPQEYLAVCLNDTVGFLACLSMVFVVMPCSAAVLTLFVSDYASEALGFQDPPGLYRKLGALAVTVVLSAINCAGNTQSKVVTKVLLACKVFGLMLILVLGLSVLVWPGDWPPVTREPAQPMHPSLSSYTDAILQALWAYSGWETVCFLPCRRPSAALVLTPTSLPSSPAKFRILSGSSAQQPTPLCWWLWGFLS